MVPPGPSWSRHRGCAVPLNPRPCPPSGLLAKAPPVGTAVLALGAWCILLMKNSELGLAGNACSCCMHAPVHVARLSFSAGPLCFGDGVYEGCAWGRGWPCHHPSILIAVEGCGRRIHPRRLLLFCCPRLPRTPHVLGRAKGLPGHAKTIPKRARDFAPCALHACCCLCGGWQCATVASGVARGSLLGCSSALLVVVAVVMRAGR